MTAVSFSWTLAWTIAPYVVAPFALIAAGRAILRRTSGEGFAADFIPCAADIDTTARMVGDDQRAEFRGAL